MKTSEPSESRAGSAPLPVFLPLAAGIITAALGFVALLGWVCGWPLLASFGAGLMPMAPSTAVLFLLFGAAIGLRARTPMSRRAFWVSVAAGCLGAMITLLLFVLSCLNVHWAVEHLGLNITGTIGGAPVGHMSPVGAFCFLLASVSFFASLSQSAIRRWRVALALGSAGVLLGTGSIFLLAYLYGAPLLYGGTFIPPALNTVLAFTMLGLALLVLAVRSSGLQGGQPEAIPVTSYVLLLIFVLLAAGIVTVGSLYFRHYEKQYRTGVEQQISAIAKLKVDELVQWRKERMTDGGIFFKNPSFSALVRRFFAQPADADAQRQLMDWLGRFPTFHSYDQFRLMDAQGVTRLSVPGGLKPATSDTLRVAAEVLRSGQITLQDFYRHERQQRVYLQVMVPILDELDAGRPLGVVELRLDPTVYLFPFIKRWPTPSRTAETLLVRREGNEAVYLNELRHQSNTVLALRLSLERIEVPAVRAALGQAGIMQGVDYRGVPVIAAAQAVPDSPWFLVAKMDTSEVYGPLRAQLWQVVVLIGVLLFGAGASVGVVWRHQRSRFYQERYESVEALRALDVRYRRLFESAKDGILILDAETGIVVDVNPFLIELLGVSRETFLGKKVWELRFLKDIVANQGNFAELQQWELGFFKDIVGNQGNFAELQEKEYIRYEDMALETSDGRRIEVEFVSNVYLVNHHKVIQCNIRDITERKRAEEALKRQTAELRARNEELERFNRASVGRELRMIELKQEINQLCQQTGLPPRYAPDV